MPPFPRWRIPRPTRPAVSSLYATGTLAGPATLCALRSPSTTESPSKVSANTRPGGSWSADLSPAVATVLGRGTSPEPALLDFARSLLAAGIALISVNRFSSLALVKPDADGRTCQYQCAAR